MAVNMRQLGAVVLAFATVLALSTALTIECDCPPTYCSDPRSVDGECCQTCEGSSCVWRGCVHFGAFGAQWYPDPCTLCGCYNGEEVCTEILCEEVQCFGYPLKNDSDVCCPQCDWGVADDECAPVPVANISLYVSLGDGVHCQDEVTKHECDKAVVAKDGEIYECRAIKRAKPVVMTDCEDIRKVVYKDTTECRLKRLKRGIQDFDANPNLCNIRV